MLVSAHFLGEFVAWPTFNLSSLNTFVSSCCFKYPRALVFFSAGNHGLDIEHPDGTRFAHPEQTRYVLLIDKLKQELELEVCRDGAWIETKGVLLTYHYRSVPQDQRSALKEQATALILKHG